MKYLIAILLIVVLLNLSRRSDETHITIPLQRTDTILAAGDSLTYGYGATLEESYPSRLARLSGLRVVNAGINGETSAEGLARLPGLLKKYRPKLTVLCYGGNDLLQKRPMAALKSNLIKMITLCKTHGSDVLLLSVPHPTLFGLEPMQLYEEVAEETQTSLLEGVLSDILEDPSLKSDHIHPNALGYEKLAKAVYRKLRELGFTAH